MGVSFGKIAKAMKNPNACLEPGVQIRMPLYSESAPRNEAVTYSALAGETEWYPPLMVAADYMSRHIVSETRLAEAVSLMERIDPDAYTDYLKGFYREGLARFGKDWPYADIVTTLMGLSGILKPLNYLEIGVRRGRSVCAVASSTPDVDLYMFDMWISNYAGMDNPGRSLVDAELDKFNHSGKRCYVNGNSHETVAPFLAEHPDLWFDIITVDGDHSTYGAIDDLCDVLPRLKVGGAIVFDDICHPAHPGLKDVWQRLLVDDGRFSTASFNEIGYGVGFAIRKW